MTGPKPEDVFARHHRDVYRYLVRMTGSRDVADGLQHDLRVIDDQRPVHSRELPPVNALGPADGLRH